MTDPRDHDGPIPVITMAEMRSYTAGVIFYAWKRLPFSHAIWHLFVLAGDAFHVFAVLYYVIPPQP